MIGLCVLAGVLLAGILAPVAIGAGLLSNQVSDSVDSISADLANSDVPLVTKVLDRNNNLVAYLYDQYRLPVSFNQMSPAIKAAVIAIEDRRFYVHAGVDLQAALRAALSNSSGGSTQGASTITQQYVKNYLINVVDRNDKAAQDQDQAQNIARKLREAKIAMQLDQNMSKDDILAGYLNIVEFTGNIYGVGAAAAAYFNTTPDRLTVPQSALLAGMVNNPILYDPYNHPQQALERRNLVIDRMVSNGSLTEDVAASAKAAPLGVVAGGPIVPSSSCIGINPSAGFFCDYAVRYLEKSGYSPDQIATGGFTIKTTMDPNVSQIAKNAVNANVPTTQDGVANTFAVIQPGQTAHDVLAMVANRNFGTDASRGETSTNIVADPSNHFGAGSSFKIFTSAAALETGKAGLATNLNNPMSGCFLLPGLDPRYNHCYPVQNDGQYSNPISLADGLATSPNVAFVDLEVQVGMAAVLRMAQRLGLRDTMRTNDAGFAPITDPTDQLSKNPQYNQSQSDYFLQKPSFTLGNSPVSPLEMANVIATLKSGGVWCEPNPIVSVTDRYGKPMPINRAPCEQVVSRQVANTLLAGLSQDSVKGTSAAAAKAANWTRPDVGKTGTTEESESVAFVGGVNNYAASSMVFADGPRPRELCGPPPIHLGSCGSGLFGGTGAAPPYFAAFNQVLVGQPNQPIPTPDPAYLVANNHGPIVPFVVGQEGSAAGDTLKHSGYQVATTEFNSTAPKGQVLYQTPQGNVATGTTITLYVSSGTIPTPRTSTPPVSSAPGSGQVPPDNQPPQNGVPIVLPPSRSQSGG